MRKVWVFQNHINGRTYVGNIFSFSNIRLRVNLKLACHNMSFLVLNSFYIMSSIVIPERQPLKIWITGERLSLSEVCLIQVFVIGLGNIPMILYIAFHSYECKVILNGLMVLIYRCFSVIPNAVLLLQTDVMIYWIFVS